MNPSHDLYYEYVISLLDAYNIDYIYWFHTTYIEYSGYESYTPHEGVIYIFLTYYFYKINSKVV